MSDSMREAKEAIRRSNPKDIKQIYDECLALSYNKRADYTSSLDNHENFKRSQEVQSWFLNDVDKPYVVLIGTKLARLASLLSTHKEPNNESVEDSFKDLINYCGLWAERRLGIPKQPGLLSQATYGGANNPEQLKQPENKEKNYQNPDNNLNRF